MEEDSTEFRFGIDIDVNTDDEEVVSHHLRVKRIENLERCQKLKRLRIVASCVKEIENLDENRDIEELEIYQGLLTQIRNIGHLTQLRVLDLSFNEIKRIEGLDSLVKLEKLYLSNNKISVMEGLEYLRNLRVLELGSNRIRSVTGLKNLTKLEQLWLGKNKISNLADLNAYSFPELVQISLQSNRLTDWAGGVLFRQVAPNLQNVYLGSNQLVDMDEATLSSFNPDTLIELDISSNALTVAPQFPRPLVRLEELWLNDNKIDSVESLKCIGPIFPVLRTIYIERNPVHSQCPLDCRNVILANAPPTLEQVDANRVEAHRVTVSEHGESKPVKSILKRPSFS
jgi:protein phosphatase 1 regulatory subunit 7